MIRYTSVLNHTGVVAERFKAHAWKACWVQALEGSNPSDTASLKNALCQKNVKGRFFMGYTKTRNINTRL